MTLKVTEPLQVTVRTLVADGDRVVAEAKGYAPTKSGGVYDNDYLFLYRVRGDLIVEAREYLDSAKFLALVQGRL